MQYYELTDFKPRDFKDNHDNTWCDALFEGVGEPVTWVVKDPSRIEVGTEYYGEIKDVESKSGKSYVRFYKKEKPDEGSNYSKPQANQEGPNWPLKDARIQFQWATGRALEHFDRKGEEYELAQVKSLAQGLSKMVDELAAEKVGQ